MRNRSKPIKLKYRGPAWWRSCFLTCAWAISSCSLCLLSRLYFSYIISELINKHMRKKLLVSKRSRSNVPIPVRAIDFVMYCAKDIRRTRTFYQRLFGLKRGGEWNDFWSEFSTSPVTVCLNGVSKRRPDWNWQGPAAVAFAVEDIHAAIGQCRRRKVKILIEPIETSVCWMAFIADPDGNRICLHQRKDGTAG